MKKAVGVVQLKIVVEIPDEVLERDFASDVILDLVSEMDYEVTYQDKEGVRIIETGILGCEDTYTLDENGIKESCLK